jgi:anti-anti-sigma factor
VDHTNFQRFQDELGAMAEGVSAKGGMVIDLGDLEFITSAGLRALLLTQKAVNESDAKLIVSGIGGVVKEVFRISKFDALLSVAETTGDAVSSVSESAKNAFKS